MTFWAALVLVLTYLQIYTEILNTCLFCSPISVVQAGLGLPTSNLRHDYTIGTLDVLKAYDACTNMGQL